MTNYEKHAMKEFQAAGWCDKDGKFEDEMQQLICKQVLRLLDEFASEEHSGTTAPYTIELFAQLAQFKPITPLTGNDNEWVEHDNDLFQNNRNSAVFKDGKDGRPYYINAWVKVWDKDHSNGWNGSILLEDGMQVTKAYIKDFSKMPTIEIPIPTLHKKDDSDWEFVPVALDSINELVEYYDIEIEPVQEEAEAEAEIAER